MWQVQTLFQKAGQCRQQMNEKEGVHIYKGILFSHKKERKLAICDSMDGPREYYAE